MKAVLCLLKFLPTGKVCNPYAETMQSDNFQYSNSRKEERGVFGSLFIIYFFAYLLISFYLLCSPSLPEMCNPPVSSSQVHWYTSITKFRSLTPLGDETTWNRVLINRDTCKETALRLASTAASRLRDRSLCLHGFIGHVWEYSTYTLICNSTEKIWCWK